MLDSSGASHWDINRLEKTIEYELKICCLLCLNSRRVAVPLSFYFESISFQRVLLKLLPLVLVQDIVFINAFSDIYSYREHKQIAYKKSSAVDRFAHAYYRNRTDLLQDVDFCFSAGSLSIASDMLTPWGEVIRARADKIGLHSEPVGDFIKATVDSEAKAFLWNSLSNIAMKHLSEKTIRALSIRSFYNAQYVATYQAMGYQTSFNSSLVQNIQLPVNYKFNIDLKLWKNLFSTSGMNQIIIGSDGVTFGKMLRDHELLKLISDADSQFFWLGRPTSETIQSMVKYSQQFSPDKLQGSSWI